MKKTNTQVRYSGLSLAVLCANRKGRILLINLFLVAIFITCSITASASTVIYDTTTSGDSYVTEIHDLLIGENSYNVYFYYDSFSNLWPSGSNALPLFWQDQTMAETAISAINNVVNGSVSQPPAPPVSGVDVNPVEEQDHPGHIEGTSDVYYIPFDGSDGTISALGSLRLTNVPPNWVSWYLWVVSRQDTSPKVINLTNTDTKTYVKFVPVPVPPTIFLLGTGLIGLVGYNLKRLRRKG